jgi:predicted dehydrogenase
LSFEDAAFTVLASIGLQGVRLAAPTLGESFVVMGLGLIGLLTVQLLKANGCRVLGLDFDPRRLELARQFGAETVALGQGEDPLATAEAFSRGRGVDGVIITASTKSSEPVHQAAQMCRQRGRIILVGVTGLELARSDFYEKELSFQVSCSYGPGRYDPSYETKGQDYPFGFVRWTEGRNFEAVLELLHQGSLKVAPLVTHRFPIAEADKAYEVITESKESLGVVLEYPTMAQNPAETLLANHVLVTPRTSHRNASKAVVGFIGAGGFTQRVLLPALQKTNASLQAISSSGGVSSVTAARKFQISEATTDNRRILEDASITTVFVTTRHDSHANLVTKALAGGKHVFVEKPLAINKAQLEQVVQCYETLVKQGNAPLLGIGFNRRFAPHVIKMKTLLSTVNEPKTFIMTVNAGDIPANHWTQDSAIGGGRIIGEACHFVDLLRFLAGAAIVKTQAMKLNSEVMAVTEDKVSLTLGFADGSIGTIHYFANGHKSFPKERLEVFVAGRILALDNFRTLTGYGWPGFKTMRLFSQDKGHHANVSAFINAIETAKPSTIPFDEIVEVTGVTLELATLLHD